MQLTLVNKKSVAENVDVFLFQPDLELDWKAGQFMRYIINDPTPDDRRTYRFFSISSAPFEKHLMLTTKFVPGDGSTFKKDLLNLKVGDSIEATGPGGDFILEDPSKSYVFIAGGIGITPFRAIIMDLDHKNLPVNITLMYANRNTDFIFKSELESVQSRHPEFKIEYFVDPQKIDEKVINSIYDHLI